MSEEVHDVWLHFLYGKKIKIKRFQELIFREQIHKEKITCYILEKV
jgi:hypothetical protein